MTSKSDLKRAAAKAMGERVRALLDAKGMSLADLDDLMGHKSRGYTSRLVRGEKPQITSAQVELIARLLDTTVDHLTSGHALPMDERTPPTPPAESRVIERPRRPAPVIAEAPPAFPDELEEAMGVVLQRPGQPKRSGSAIVATKVFILHAAPKMRDDQQEELLAKALDAATELEGEKIVPTPDAIMTRLLEYAIARQTPSERRRSADMQAAHDERVRVYREEKAKKSGTPTPPEAPGKRRKS